MNAAEILNDIYQGNLKSVDEIKKNEQDKEQAKLKRELRWQQTLKEEGMVSVISMLDNTIKESHDTLLAITLNAEYTDAQVRNFLVRYSTLCRTKNAVMNNNEII